MDSQACVLTVAPPCLPGHRAPGAPHRRAPHAAGHMEGATPVSFLRVVGSGEGSPGQWTDGQDALLLTSPTYLSLSKAPPMHTRAHTSFWLTPMSPCALVLDLGLLQNLLRKGR